MATRAPSYSLASDPALVAIVKALARAQADKDYDAAVAASRDSAVKDTARARRNLRPL